MQPQQWALLSKKEKGAEATATKGPLANATAAMGIVIEERKGTEATATKGPLANATAAMGIVIEERKGTEATATKGPLANATAAMGIVSKKEKGQQAKATQHDKGPLADATAAMGIIIERNLTTFANMSESVRKAANLYQAANLSMLSKRSQAESCFFTDHGIAVPPHSQFQSFATGGVIRASERLPCTNLHSNCSNFVIARASKISGKN